MRFSIIAAVAAFSSTVLAQLDQIPKCAQTCFGNNLGTCGPVDIGCVCGNKSVINSVSCCVFATCSQDEIKRTIDFAVNLCKANNIDVNTNPTCPANGTASASASASASAGASGSAAASGATPSVTGITGSATPSRAAATSTGAAASLQSTGAGLGLGMAMAGLLAML